MTVIRRGFRGPLAAGLCAATLLIPVRARAAGIIKNPDEHPHYTAEIEPHVLFGNDNYFNSGFGVGARVSFPVMDPGFIKGINDTVAISAGLDLFFLNDCYYRNETNCSATNFTVPVVLQWNFYVAPHISVFGEPGIALQFYNFDNCPAGIRCDEPSRTHFVPFVLYGGMRYHFNDKIAITPRLGFDNYGAFYLSFGVSFFAGGG